MASDKTFGVKVSEELREKVSNMIESSGLQSKEWFEKAVSLYEMQSLKEGAKDFTKDISELEMHTTRIYELVANMIKRAGYEKDAVERKLEEFKQSREEVVMEYQRKLKEEKEARLEAEELTSLHEQEKEEAQKQLDDLKNANENNQALILEYKEKIDTLSGLVNKYQQHQEENEQLRSELHQQKEAFEAQLASTTQEWSEKVNTYEANLATTSQENRKLVEQLERLNELLEQTKERQELEIERMNEKHEVEREKALLELERKHQQAITKLNEEYNRKIREQYDEIASMRKEYEQRIEELTKKK